MSKNEFLKELRDYLTGNVSASEVEDSVRYYDNYIDGQVKSGQPESQVIAGLGDPRIIGKSIVDASGRKKTVYETGDADTKSTGKGAGGRAGKLKLYGIIALVILVILVVLIAITKVVAFFFPLIVVILIITMIFRRSGGGR